MIITKKAQAGSFESADILILVEPTEKGEGRKIEFTSVVEEQFGEQILRVIHQVLDEQEIVDIYMVVQDKGAIETVIKSRLETALLRASEQQKGTMY